MSDCIDRLTTALLIKYNNLVLNDADYNKSFGEYIRERSPLIYNAIVKHYEEEKREKA